ncbi:MAG: pseudouridine synthase, partial [Candidatus Eisenbacteria bacterium]
AERAGIARRKCDAAILDGQVTVDGAVVVTPGIDVDPLASTVTLRGRALDAQAPGAIHLLFHKPLGVLVTWSDPQGRRTVRDYVPPGMPRLFAVGRLDFDTSGLLVLTNDGDLAHRLAHPRYEVPKVYRIALEYPPTAEQVAALEQGIDLGEGERSSPARARKLTSHTLELTIAEGKKRQVRRMCKAVGLWLTALERVAFGPLVLGTLAPGKTRPLTPAELTALRAATQDKPATARTRGATSGVRGGDLPAKARLPGRR